MNCPKCSSEEIHVYGNLLIHFPFKYYSKLSKKVIAKKEVVVDGFNWDRCRIVCLTCGHALQSLIKEEEDE